MVGPGEVPVLGETDIPTDGGGEGTPVPVTNTLPRTALPFTGIEDAFLPLLLGLIALLTGVIAYRYAAVREALTAVARVTTDKVMQRPTGYGYALQTIEQRNSAAAAV